MSGLKFDTGLGFGIILTLAIQTAGALMWGGAANARIHALEDHMKTPPASERLARLEEQMRMAGLALARIERRLDSQAGGRNEQ